MKYPGIAAYHFPAGPSHTSPCMSQYFHSPEYQAKKEQWFREAGVQSGISIPIDHDEKPDEEPEDCGEA